MLFFFSLQKFFTCRVAKEIAYVRENTPLSIDSIKSYPTSCLLYTSDAADD